MFCFSENSNFWALIDWWRTFAATVAYWQAFCNLMTGWADKLIKHALKYAIVQRASPHPFVQPVYAAFARREPLLQLIKHTAELQQQQQQKRNNSNALGHWAKETFVNCLPSSIICLLYCIIEHTRRYHGMENIQTRTLTAPAYPMHECKSYDRRDGERASCNEGDVIYWTVAWLCWSCFGIWLR